MLFFRPRGLTAMAWGNDQIRELVIRTLLGESNRTPEGMVSVAHVMKNGDIRWLRAARTAA